MKAYAYRLGELGLSHSEFEYLAQRMLELAQETENAPPQRRLVVDKSLLRLVRLLPKELAVRFVAPYLDHPRKTRRKWAYAALRDMSISELDAARLAEVYRKTGDEDLVTFILKTRDCVRLLGADFLLRQFDAEGEDYRRGRVLQALLLYDRAAALAISRKLPWEFVYAAGRSEDSTLVPAVRSLFKANAHNGTFLAIYAWALGKLGARKELASFERFVQKQIPR